MSSNQDCGKDGLLALNGDRYFIDDKGDFEVVFKVISVAATPERPHGLLIYTCVD